MVPHYNIDNDFCEARIIEYDIDWLVIYYLSKPVNNDKDAVMYFAFPVCGYW